MQALAQIEFPSGVVAAPDDELVKRLAQKCVCGHALSRHAPKSTPASANRCDECECAEFWIVKQASGSPQRRSLATMHNRRYLCQVVEHWVPGPISIRRDLYGFIDILCIRGEDIVGVQATSWGNVSSRVSKISEHENYPKVIAAMRLLIQGWHKKAGRWVMRETEL